jgi:hypothetical protein
LEAELDRVEGLARSVSTGRFLIAAMGMRETMSSDPMQFLIPEDTEVVGPYFETTAPASVLRRIKADRALLTDLLAETHTVVDGDCWYTCLAATEERDGGTSCREDDTAKASRCDCGRDAAVERRVRLIAQGWGWEAGS